MNPFLASNGRIGTGWIFLGLVLLLYGTIALFDAELVRDCLVHFVDLLYKLVPVLLVVFGLVFLLNLYLNREQALKNLGPQAGQRGWAMTIVAGVLSLGPVYVWYPLLRDLKEIGMLNSLVAGFL